MRRSFGVLGGVTLAIVLSQFPEYAQQYTQRLGGAVDELHVITTDFDQGATVAGLTHDQAISHYESSPDKFLAGRGLDMAATFTRYQSLSATLADVKGADAWQRFRHLPDYLDSDIGARTLDSFQPALPVTPEGLTYAAIGFVLGYLIFSALWSLLLLPFKLLWPRRRFERT